MRCMRLSPRPNLFFDGERVLVDWFMDAFEDQRRKGQTGPQAFMIRDNGFPQILSATQITARHFIYVVGIYNIRKNRHQVEQDLHWFWIRNIGGKQ